MTMYVACANLTERDVRQIRLAGVTWSSIWADLSMSVIPNTGSASVSRTTVCLLYRLGITTGWEYLRRSCRAPPPPPPPPPPPTPHTHPLPPPGHTAGRDVLQCRSHRMIGSSNCLPFRPSWCRNPACHLIGLSGCQLPPGWGTGWGWEGGPHYRIEWPDMIAICPYRRTPAIGAHFVHLSL